MHYLPSLFYIVFVLQILKISISFDSIIKTCARSLILINDFFIFFKSLSHSWSQFPTIYKCNNNLNELKFFIYSYMDLDSILLFKMYCYALPLLLYDIVLEIIIIYHQSNVAISTLTSFTAIFNDGCTSTTSSNDNH